MLVCLADILKPGILTPDYIAVHYPAKHKIKTVFNSLPG